MLVAEDLYKEGMKLINLFEEKKKELAELGTSLTSKKHTLSLEVRKDPVSFNLSKATEGAIQDVININDEINTLQKKYRELEAEIQALEYKIRLILGAMYSVSSIKTEVHLNE